MMNNNKLKTRTVFFLYYLDDETDMIFAQRI
jgi:hypothetical protein